MSYQINFRHFNYFLAVADELHFRKAAEKLFISQPGLSRQIKQMEDGLKLKLFERHNRKVRLTPVGSYLQKEFQSCIQNIERSIDHAKLLTQGTTGNLKIGHVGSAMQQIIPQYLLDIRKQLPAIQFNLKEMDNRDQIEGVINQRIDLGFVRLDRVPREVNMRPVLEETFSLVLPIGHQINQTSFKSLKQLKDEPFILFEPNYSESYYEKVMQIFDHAGFSPIISHKTIHANTIYRLVENNFGVSIVPTSLTEGYNMKIQFIELTTSKLKTTLQMIWSKNNDNPILANVVDLMNDLS